jgi:glycerol-3-phosphate dehydrogenase (NAD+)
MFRVHVIEDVSGVSLSGALKNIVAMAAGFVDGLELGGNTKSAILRIGLIEMSNFTLEFFPDASPDTFSHHSAGVADLITTSFGGRNRKCAEAFVRTGKSFDVLEEELLDGQKLQGAVTSKEIYEFLEARGRLDGCVLRLSPLDCFLLALTSPLSLPSAATRCSSRSTRFRTTA